jgi:hypothetical protein
MPADEASAPWSEEAEIGVLGAMLIDEEARDEALERLSPEDFYREDNRRIFRAFFRLTSSGRAVDVLVVADELRTAGELEAAGGMKYLAQLIDAVPSAANLSVHAHRLQELRAMRDLQDVTEEAHRAAAEAGPGEGGDVVARLRDRLAAVERLAAHGDDLGDVDRLTLREALNDPSLLEPPEPVLEGMGYRGQSTLAVGGPKDGKTTLLLSAAAAVSGGSPWLGSPTRQGYVVWLMGEGDRSQILRGLHRFGADPDAVEAVVAGANPVDELRQIVEAHEPALVVVDTWNTWSAALEIDGWKESEVAPVLRRMERIVREAGVALVLIHHSRKADDEPMGSTAIKAWADVVRTLKPGDGPQQRRIEGTARFPVPNLHYRLVEDADEARVEPVDPERAIEERVLEFLKVNPESSKREIREGVDGRNPAIEDAIASLERDGLVEVDRSGRAHLHRIAQDPYGHATGTVRARSGHGGEGNQAITVPESVPPSLREGDPRAQFAEPSVEPNRCEECGTKIGPTSELCGGCKRQRGNT